MVKAMVDAFPNGGANAGKSYIGALAAVLVDYPRSVAVRCADPVRGVARETRFLPTVSDLVAWCERESAPLHRQAHHEKRIAEQLAARAEWQDAEPSARMIEKTKAWLDRTDPDARQLTAGSEAEMVAREERDKREAERAMARSTAGVIAEWGGKEPPTIAGLPISRELARKLGVR